MLFGSSEQLSNIRDPFRRPLYTSADRPKTELETIPLDQFRLLGVVTGPKQVRAMLMGPNSKTYVVTEQTLIGTRNGQVTKIRPNSVLVKERVPNVMGQEEDVSVEIGFPGLSQGSGG
jgi:Tfp pilus assembly protein PilP